MNIIDTYINPLEEEKVCKNIYEVLAHIAIFKPLLSCVFMEFTNQSVNGMNVFPDQKAWRENFIRQEDNIEKIINYFEQKDNTEKFAGEVEKFYLEHKEAFDKLGINNNHKNTYSIALASIKTIASQKTSKNKINNTSVELDHTGTLKAQVEVKFKEILESQQEFEVAGDIEGNLFDGNSGNIKNYFDKKAIKINGKYIDPDTRKEIFVEGCKIVSLYRTVELLNGEKVKRAKIVDFDGKEKILYIAKENQFFRIDGERVLEVYHNEFGGNGIYKLPSGTELIEIFLENKGRRYITNENKIFKIEGNEKFSLFHKKGSLLFWEDIQKITKTRKLSIVELDGVKNFRFVTNKNKIFRIEFEGNFYEPFELEEKRNRKYRKKLFHGKAKGLKFIITSNGIEKFEKS